MHRFSIHSRPTSLVAALACLLIAEIVGIADPALALPRYSARYGQDCSLCHQDPTGGGMRSSYASQFLIPTELAARPLSYEAIERIESALSDVVATGVDLRTLIYQRDDDEGSIFAMQSDVYLAMQLDDRTSAYLDIGQRGTQQFFGLLRVLPANGYIKAGRFAPNYGWRFSDHQLPSRKYVLNTDGSENPAIWYDSSIEFGMSPGRWKFSGSLEAGGGETGESYTLRGVRRQSIGSLNLALGASMLRRQGVHSHRSSKALFGYAHFRRLGWIVQWDEPRCADRRERIVSQELSWELRQGVWLRSTFGFHDPSRDFESGTRTQWGFGVDALITPHVGLLVMAKRFDIDAGQDIVEAEDSYGADLVLHFLY